MMILTRGMGERLTYGIPSRYHVVLMERLGGLFFDGGRSCVGDSFRWSFGSVSLRVSRGEYRPYAIPHVTKRETDSGRKSGYYAAILSGKEDRGIGA